MVTNFWFTALPWVHYLNFQDKELYHAARFEKATRYYVIRLEKDLLDDWVINICNGRIKSKLGQSRILAFQSLPATFEQFCFIAKERKQRRYQLKTYQTDDLLYRYLLFWVISRIDLLPENKKVTKQKIVAVTHLPLATQRHCNQQFSLNFL